MVSHGKGNLPFQQEVDNRLYEILQRGDDTDRAMVRPVVLHAGRAAVRIIPGPEGGYRIITASLSPFGRVALEAVNISRRNRPLGGYTYTDLFTAPSTGPAQPAILRRRSGKPDVELTERVGEPADGMPKTVWRAQQWVMEDLTALEEPARDGQPGDGMDGYWSDTGRLILRGALAAGVRLNPLVEAAVQIPDLLLDRVAPAV